MTRRERAMSAFMQGYNCAQSIVLAFADLLPIDEAALSRLSSSFGGGMGRMREVCGTVSGMFMAAGLAFSTPDNDKAKQYKIVQELAQKFKDKNGSIICRELLQGIESSTSPVPSERTETYYKKRPCVELVGDSVEIFEEYLKEAKANSHSSK